LPANLCDVKRPFQPAVDCCSDVFGRESLFAAQSAFPNLKDTPAVGCKRKSHCCVPDLGSPNLVAPKLGPFCRPMKEVTVVTVPKATMHKDDGTLVAKNDVRFADDVRGVCLKGYTQLRESSRDQHFHLCVLGTSRPRHRRSQSNVLSDGHWLELFSNALGHCGHQWHDHGVAKLLVGPCVRGNDLEGLGEPHQAGTFTRC